MCSTETIYRLDDILKMNFLVKLTKLMPTQYHKCFNSIQSGTFSVSYYFVLIFFMGVKKTLTKCHFCEFIWLKKAKNTRFHIRNYFYVIGKRKMVSGLFIKRNFLTRNSILTHNLLTEWLIRRIIACWVAHIWTCAQCPTSHMDV